MARRIYLDYASLTPIDPRVLREMKAFSASEYANPSSIYREGVTAKKALDDMRTRVAAFLHAHADEIVFTSGGTEANALVLEGAGRAAHRNGITKPHLIISAIEHSSVMETAAMLEKHGVEVTRLPVDASGRISPDELRAAIKPTTYLVSIMTVNNEIGSIQPIRDIAKAVRWARTNITKSQYPLFHTDAAQAALSTDLAVDKLGVDFLTLDGSKVCGPRGTGALYVRRNVPIEPTIYGGGQERGLRSGTENIPGIAGLAAALDIAGKERDAESKRLSDLKVFMSGELMKLRADIRVNSAEPAAPHILNISIPGIDNEFFVLQLDARGVAVSTKSSCLRDEDESYVLKAIGALSRESVRISFGRFTTKSDIKAALRAFGEVLAKTAPKR